MICSRSVNGRIGAAELNSTMLGVIEGILTSAGGWLEMFERELNRGLNGLLSSGSIKGLIKGGLLASCD